MDHEIRPVTDDEFVEYHKTMGVGFGYQPSEAAIENSRPLFERDRSVGTFDAGRMVATAGVFSLEVTLPGPQPVRAGGVTAVSVHPTHRRQGVLTAMMAHMLDDIAGRGEPLAILWASESVIYGRFGYGIASSTASFQIERAHARLAHRDEAPGRTRVVDKDTASKILPDVFDRFRRTYPGAVSRSPGWWHWHLYDPEFFREGFSPRFFLIHETPQGSVDGYASYRTKEHWPDGSPHNIARVGEVIAETPATRTALWETCLDLDLTARIEGLHAPVDLPLRWQLADPRRYNTKQLTDALWVRMLDVATVLSTRRFNVDGRLVFDVHDAFRPDVAGRYELDAGPDGATCRRSRRKADLELDVSDLGALSFGGVSAHELGAAGRIHECTRGAISRADAMFASHPAPWCNTEF